VAWCRLPKLKWHGGLSWPMAARFSFTHGLYLFSSGLASAAWFLRQVTSDIGVVSGEQQQCGVHNLPVGQNTFNGLFEAQRRQPFRRTVVHARSSNTKRFHRNIKTSRVVIWFCSGGKFQCGKKYMRLKSWHLQAPRGLEQISSRLFSFHTHSLQPELFCYLARPGSDKVRLYCSCFHFCVLCALGMNWRMAWHILHYANTASTREMEWDRVIQLPNWQPSVINFLSGWSGKYPLSNCSNKVVPDPFHREWVAHSLRSQISYNFALDSSRTGVLVLSSNRMQCHDQLGKNWPTEPNATTPWRLPLGKSRAMI